MDCHWCFGSKNMFPVLTCVLFRQNSYKVHKILSSTHKHDVSSSALVVQFGLKQFNSKEMD